jgi:chromosomal replication initiation ATPase DnaA
MSMTSNITPTQQEARDQHVAFRRRIAEKAATLAKTPLPQACLMKSPPARHVEIAEAIEADTKIDVVACNGQVVFVGMTEFAESAETVKRTLAKRLTIERIQAAVCRFYQIPRVEILSARREAKIVRPRQVAMYLAKTLTVRSLPEIGRMFGGRDHTTILHAVRKIGALVARDPDLNEVVEKLKATLREAC